MRVSRLASALAAFGVANALAPASMIPQAAAAPPETARVVIDADPLPVVDLKKLSPAVADLFCPPKDKACGKDGARAVAEAKGWVETPRVDVKNVIADCESKSRIAAQSGGGVSAFQICLWDRRPRTLWLPAAGFRLPRKGWFAFSWSTPGSCGNGNDGCFTTGLLDLATGAMAVRRDMEPKGEDEPVQVETMTGDVSLDRSRASVLLAVLGLHAVARRVAIAAAVSPDLVPQGASGAERLGRLALLQSVADGNLDYRWAWLSPAGDVWAKGADSSSTGLGNLVGAHIRHMADTLVPGCPPGRPGMDAAVIRAALAGAQAVEAIAELRAAFGQCRGGR
jgi:hypothetical protein